jgi:PAS domain-containing protein
MTDFLQLVRDVVGPILDAIPYPVFIVDDDVSIIGLNKASQQYLGQDPDVVVKRRAGEVLHCMHSLETLEGCGRSESCIDCPIRKAVNRAYQEDITTRERIKVEILTRGETKEAHLSIIASPFVYHEKRYVLLQFENITEVLALQKLLPICSVCHRIRNDDEYWHRIESYFYKYLDLKFSHGICPDCLKSAYSELDKTDTNKK